MENASVACLKIYGIAGARNRVFFPVVFSPAFRWDTRTAGEPGKKARVRPDRIPLDFAFEGGSTDPA